MPRSWSNQTFPNSSFHILFIDIRTFPHFANRLGGAPETESKLTPKPVVKVEVERHCLELKSRLKPRSSCALLLQRVNELLRTFTGSGVRLCVHSRYRRSHRNVRGSGPQLNTREYVHVPPSFAELPNLPISFFFVSCVQTTMRDTSRSLQRQRLGGMTWIITSRDL